MMPSFNARLAETDIPHAIVVKKKHALLAD